METKRRMGMLKAGPLLAVLLLGLILSGCTGVGTVPKGWSGGTLADHTLFVGSMEGTLVAVNTSDGSRLWSVPLEATENAGGGGCAPSSSSKVAIYGSPAVGGELVYIGGYNGKIYAFALGREEPRWIYPRQGTLDGPIVGGVAVAQGKIYFGSANGKVYALDAAQGYKEWEFATEDKVWATPAVVDNTLFIASFDKKLYALNATDGSKKWEFKTEGAIASTALVYNNTVYIGSFDRYLYAVDAFTGSLKWKFMGGNWFWTRPVVYNDIIYAACLDGKVYALDAGGNKVAEFDLGGPISSSPVTAGSSVIVATEGGAVYSLGNNNQQRKLTSLNETVRAPLAASQDTVFIHTDKNLLYSVVLSTGATREFDIK